MKPAPLKEIKTALAAYPPQELMELCLKMAKFKKEVKEYLTYLIFEAPDEEAYIRHIKRHMDAQFEEINTHSYYFVKKRVRKILRETKKFIRFSKKKDTEAQLLFYFLQKLLAMYPPIKRNSILKGIYERQYKLAEKAVGTLHEDLQFDYEKILMELNPDQVI